FSSNVSTTLTGEDYQATRHDTRLADAGGRARPAFLVSRRRCSIAGASSVSAQRQSQFPLARPGTFMRASLPRLSTSCRGATVSAARDDQARASSAGTTWASVSSLRSRSPQTLRRRSADSSRYQPRVVALSCVPVYTTVLLV